MKRTRKSRSKLGQEGEAQAKAYLEKQNYQILATNFSSKQGEIDIIALDEREDQVVFVEVKYRSSERFGHPSLAVDNKKLARMIKTARIYLARSNWEKGFRFDIIAVLPERVEQFKNITLEFD